MTATHDDLRLPDFIIVGAMKAGTTSLFEWLGSHPDVSLPHVKEPNFFVDDRAWSKGPASYGRVFEHAATDHLTGEASVSYSDPVVSQVVAERMQSLIPGVKVVFLTRDPVSRMRSHYIHAVRRRRERAPFLQAISPADSSYRRRSRYMACLGPFLECFPARVFVAPMERVFDPEESDWYALLQFLDLGPIPPPLTAVNVGAAKQQFRRPMRMLWESGFRGGTPEWLPASARAFAKRMLLSDGRRENSLVLSANSEVPRLICEELDSQLRQLSGVVSRLSRSASMGDESGDR